LIEGFKAFDAGCYHQAHELWELACWQALPLGYEKLFYQGLIQLAVALLHKQRGNRVGYHRLLERAHIKLWGLAYLMAPSTVLFEVDLKPLLAQSAPATAREKPHSS
jgi:predicted metal-dependent hydrolase